MLGAKGRSRTAMCSTTTHMTVNPVNHQPAETYRQEELSWCCYTHSKSEGTEDIFWMLHLKTRRKSIDRSSGFH